MPKIRVLIVDDAVVMRKILAETLSTDPDIEIVGSAANGRIGLQKISQVNPDIITLDVEMPDMDGVTMLKELRKTYPKLPVIMFSTLTSRGAETTLEALSLGASDYVTKPSNVGNVTECIARLQSELLPKIKVHCRHLGVKAPNGLPATAGKFIRPSSSLRTDIGPIEIVCLATSTGGPNALAEVFSTLNPKLQVPIVIVQHMPPIFTALLAERLTTRGTVKCFEGTEGQVLEAGCSYIAPGGKHMEIARASTSATVHLHEGPPENSCRPAADVLFRSVAAAYGRNTLGVVMTGMGHDGMRGCELIHEKGGYVVVQDEVTSVVWSMPGSVAQAGYADKVLPISQIGSEINRIVSESRRLTVNRN